VPSLAERKARVERYLAQDIWTAQPEGRWRRRGIGLLRFAILTHRHFNDDHCFSRAGGLAYTTVFSIVPVLAVLFALISAFEPFRAYEDRIMGFVLQQIIPSTEQGESPELTKKFLEEKQQDLREASTAIGAVGVGVLVLSIISLMAAIEKTFNVIWQVRKGRSLLLRVIYYWAMTIVPIFVVISLAFAASLTSSDAVQWLKTLPAIQGLSEQPITSFIIGAGTPLFFMWIAFTVLYVYLPNTSVRLESALIGGGVAAVLFEATKWANFIFSTSFMRYKVLYGAFAAVPIFLVWLYFAWVIVLLGAVMSHVHQNFKTLTQEARQPRITQADRESAGIRVLALIARRFHLGEPALTRAAISEWFDLSVGIISDLCRRMAEAGILTEVRDGEPVYQPARDLERITVKNVIDCLRRDGASELKWEMHPEDKIVVEIFKRGESAADQVYASTNFADIAERMTGGKQPNATAAGPDTAGPGTALKS